MNQVIKLKRSGVSGHVPTPSQLDLGEVGVNYYDGRFFFKRDNGSESIVELAGKSYVDSELAGKATPADISSAISALVGAAPAALDTLYEIASALNDNASAFTDLLSAISNSVKHSFNNQSGTSYSVVASDVTDGGTVIVELDNSSAITVTLPTPTSLGKTTGQKVNFQMAGSGIPTLVAGSGATLHGNAVFSAQYEIKTAVVRDGATWRIIGAQ